MRLSTALVGTYLSIALIVAVVGVVGQYTSHQVTNNFQTITDETGPKLTALTGFLSQARRMQQEGLSIVLLQMDDGDEAPSEDDPAQADRDQGSVEDDPTITAADADDETRQRRAEEDDDEIEDEDEDDEESEEEEYAAAYALARQELARYQDCVRSPAEAKLVNELRRMIESLDRTVLAITQQPHAAGYQDASEQWEVFEETEEQIEELAESGMAHAMEQLADQQKRASASVLAARWINLSASLLAVVGSIVLGVAMSRKIARPIASILRGAGRLGRGELDERIEVKAHQEVQSLAEAFNTLGRDLQARQERQDRAHDQLRQLNSSLQEANAEALAATRSKSEFLANMSHEIRTPMTAILGFAEVLLEAGSGEDADLARVEAAQTIRKNGAYLLSIVNDILDLSKVEAGKMVVERIACNPCELIGEVASLVRVQADGKNLSFNVEYVGAVPATIQTDPTRLRQLLINLLGNAIKFTEQGGVRLITRLADHGRKPVMQFDVVDTGIGMAAEQVAKLFQPFVQADASTTREYGGTGLGLSLSKRLAEMLGGEIAVVETRKGIGTRLRLTVAAGPLDKVELVEDPMPATVIAPEPAAVSADRPGLQGCRILLAEDGPDNQRLIVHFLKAVGADVTVTENGRLAASAALAACDDSHPFDVILMDMQMPVMDGYQATSLLRQGGYTRPIIALTAHAMEGDRRKCMDAGCDDYASKPINREKLVETIRGHLQPVEVQAGTA